MGYKSLLFLLFIFGFSETFAKRSSNRLSASKKNLNNVNATSIENGHRSAKLLPFLALVTFPNDMCKGDSGESGVCMTKNACMAQGGTETGTTCAMGYGTCCVITQACSGNTSTVKLNGTKLTQGTNGFEEICRYEIPRQAGVCQIRLDFESFSIDEGSSAALFGTCDSDTLTISGNSNGMLGALCGNLDNQHMYLNYGANDKISLDLFLTSDMGQKWNILVTMIKCGSTEMAPDGCLQYYTSQRGTVKSFNYLNQHQLNDQDYAVCVRSNPGMKKITWKSCGGTYDFLITGVPPALPAPGEPGEAIGEQLSGDNCTTDWVMIFGQNKYCGSEFPATAISMTQPFMMQVHFDHYELPLPVDLQPPDDSNTGFCLMYAQSPY